MAWEDCKAFVDRIRADADLAREVAEKGRDRTALLAIARSHGFDIDAADLEALSAAYEMRRNRP